MITHDPKAETQKRIARTEAYAEKVRTLFAQTVNQILALNKRVPTLDDGAMYSFDGENMRIQKQVEFLLRQLHSVATMAIKKGITLEWEQANQECDKLVSSLFGKKVLESAEFSAWNNHNSKARDAFINRSEKGLNLSDRVWQSVRQLRDEMEVAMTVAIGEGDSAQSMSKAVRKYLNDPDLMFRRFRYKDENGEWQRKWKKRIKTDDGKYKWIDYDRDDYKTGAGVYKSSAKNAMRVARTETNIAYRRADNERWSQMDFVLGQKIQLSKSHPQKDICDKLEGDYPKDFVFDGWHPQCFCFVTPILADWEEQKKMEEAMIKGEKYVSPRMVRNYPQGFKDWVTEHADNISAARNRGTEPYFIRNNADVIDDILNPDKKKPLTLLEKAKLRHEARTPEQIAEIKARAEERQKKHALIRKTADNILKVAGDYGEVDYSTLQKYVDEGNLDKMQIETKAVAQQVLAMKKQEQALSTLIPDAHEWHKQFTIAELQGAYNAVENMIKKHKGETPQQLMSTMKFEADWCAKHPKYKTSIVVQKAYEHKAKEIEEQIKWEDIKQKHKLYLSKYASSFPHLVQELTDAVNAKNLSGAEAAAIRIREWDLVISQREQMAVSLGAVNAGLLKPVDDAIRAKNKAEADKALKSLAKWQPIIIKRGSYANVFGSEYSGLLASLDNAIKNNKPIVAKNECVELDKWAEIIGIVKDAEVLKQTADLKKLLKEIKPYIKAENIIQAESISKKLEKFTSLALEEYCKKHYTEEFTVNSQDSYDDVMTKMGKATKPIWENLSEEEKQAFVDYCDGYSREILIDIAQGNKNKRVELIDKAMSKIKYPHDIVLRSGQNFCMAEYIFDRDFRTMLEDISNSSKEGTPQEKCAALNAKHAGKVGLNVAWMSTSFNEHGGFSKEFELHIFCPKGTSMMNVYVLSPFGAGEGTSWDGSSYPKHWSASGETEIFLGRNLQYKFVRAEAGAGKGGTTRVYIQIIGAK